MLAGYNASASTEKEKSASQQPASAAAKAPASPTQGALTGKVVETMNSGGYTYVCLQKQGKKTWVAVPEMKVSVGQELALQPGAEMTNFPSKTLNRTFDRIIFSGGPASPQGASVKPAGGMMGAGSMGASAPAAKNVKVEKATGADAYTVGEVFSKRKALHQKTVVVRGKVVKVSAGIMGSNWIHVQDGTGDAKKNTHDLVVTTQELPTVGDVVTLKGTVSMDKDFGAGYRYDVIVEKASIQR